MTDYLWKLKFKFNNLLVESPIKEKTFEFNSPFFPSTEKEKNFTEGLLSIEWDSSDFSIKYIVKEGLEAIFALTNRVYVPCNVEITDSPPGLIGISGNMSAYTTYNVNDANQIPQLWHNYNLLRNNNCLELTSSIRWYMRAVKADDPIDKFIYAWITFNMLYGWLTDAAGDNHKKGIKGLLGKGLPSIKKQREIVNRNDSIFSVIAQKNLIDRYGIDRAEELRNSLPTNNPTRIIEGAIDAIGYIRHNIFHGSLVDKTNEAKRCIWPLLHINSEIIKQKLLKISKN